MLFSFGAACTNIYIRYIYILHLFSNRFWISFICNFNNNIEYIIITRCSFVYFMCANWLTHTIGH